MSTQTMYFFGNSQSAKKWPFGTINQKVFSSSGHTARISLLYPVFLKKEKQDRTSGNPEKPC